MVYWGILSPHIAYMDPMGKDFEDLKPKVRKVPQHLFFVSVGHFTPFGSSAPPSRGTPWFTLSF